MDNEIIEQDSLFGKKHQYTGICSRCSGLSDVVERWVACRSRSCWTSKNNYPVPATPSWVDDDIKSWNILLCRACQLKGYVDFLTVRMKRSLTFLKWSPFMFIGSIVGFVILNAMGLKDMIQRNAIMAPYTYLVFFAATMMLAGFFVASIFGAPFNLLRYLFDRRKLKLLEGADSLPAKRISAAFTGEAQRIITALERGSHAEVTGSYALPVYRERAEHEKWRNEAPGQFNRTNRSRDVLFVAATRSELEKRLSPEGKKLLS